MKTATTALFDWYYHSRRDFVSGTAVFHAMCTDHFPQGSRLLEIGAGPANETSDFLAGIGPVTGVDVSDEVHGNRALSEAATYDGNGLPFGPETFDGCISNYVLEHIADPMRHFAEVRRVLRPGGVYCFRTPNLFHYVTLGSRVLPHSIHCTLANRLRALPLEAHEPWRTYYRCNTLRTLARTADAARLRLSTLRMFEGEPCYARAHRALFYPMMMYERLVNSTEALDFLRVNIFAAFERPLSEKAGRDR